MTILPKTPSSIPLNKNSPTDSSSSKNNNPGPANDLSSSVPSLRAKSSLSNPSSKLSASIKKTSNQVSQPSVQNYSSKSHPSSKNYNKPFDPSSSKIRPPKIRKLPNNHTPNTTTSRPASRQASSAPKNIYARSTSRNQRRVLSPNPNSAQPASSINSSPQHRINSAASVPSLLSNNPPSKERMLASAAGSSFRKPVTNFSRVKPSSVVQDQNISVKHSNPSPVVSERLLELSKSRPRKLCASIKQREELAKKEEGKLQSLYSPANRRSPEAKKNASRHETPQRNTPPSRLKKPSKFALSLERTSTPNLRSHLPANPSQPLHESTPSPQGTTSKAQPDSTGTAQTISENESLSELPPYVENIQSQNISSSPLPDSFLNSDPALQSLDQAVPPENIDLPLQEEHDSNTLSEPPEPCFTPTEKQKETRLLSNLSSPNLSQSTTLSQEALPPSDKSSNHVSENQTCQTQFDSPKIHSLSINPISKSPNSPRSASVPSKTLPFSNISLVNQIPSSPSTKDIPFVKPENNLPEYNNSTNSKDMRTFIKQLSPESKFNTFSGEAIESFFTTNKNRNQTKTENTEIKSSSSSPNFSSSKLKKLSVFQISKMLDSQDCFSEESDQEDFVLVKTPNQTKLLPKDEYSLSNIKTKLSPIYNPLSPTKKQPDYTISGLPQANQDSGLNSRNSISQGSGDRDSFFCADADTDFSLEKSHFSIGFDQVSSGLASESSLDPMSGSSCALDQIPSIPNIYSKNDVNFYASKNHLNFNLSHPISDLQGPTQTGGQFSSTLSKHKASDTDIYLKSLDSTYKNESNSLSNQTLPKRTNSLDNLSLFSSSSASGDVDKEILSVVNNASNIQFDDSSAYKAILENYKKRELDNRKSAILEIVESEFLYLSDLLLLHDLFFKSDKLDSSSPTSPSLGFSDEDKTIIFGNLDAIIENVKNLVLLLFHSINNEFNALPNSLRFYHVFDYMSEKIESVYSFYCANYTDALNRLSEIIPADPTKQPKSKVLSNSSLSLHRRTVSVEKLFKDFPINLRRKKGNKSLKNDKSQSSLNEYSLVEYPPALSYTKSVADFLSTQQKKLAGKSMSWNLESLLIKPVQRILKYHLLLSRLSQYSDGEFVNFYTLTTKRYTLLAERVNEYTKGDGSTKFLSIHKSMVAPKKYFSRNHVAVAPLNKASLQRSMSQHVQAKKLDQNIKGINFHTDAELLSLQKQLTDWVDYLNNVLKSIHTWEDKVRENLQQLNIQAMSFSSFLSESLVSDFDSLENSIPQITHSASVPAKNNVTSSNKAESLSSVRDTSGLKPSNTIYLNDQSIQNYCYCINNLITSLFSSSVHQPLRRRAYIPILQMIKVFSQVKKYLNKTVSSSSTDVHSLPRSPKFSTEDSVLLKEEIPRLFNYQGEAIQIIFASLQSIQRQFYEQSIKILFKKNICSKSCAQESSNALYNEQSGLRISVGGNFSEQLDFNLVKNTIKNELRISESGSEDTKSKHHSGNRTLVVGDDDGRLDFSYSQESSVVNHSAFPDARNTNGSVASSELKGQKNEDSEISYPSPSECHLYLSEIAMVYAHLSDLYSKDSFDSSMIKFQKNKSNADERSVASSSFKNSSFMSKLSKVTNFIPKAIKKKASSGALIHSSKSTASSKRSPSIISISKSISTVSDNFDEQYRKKLPRASMSTNRPHDFLEHFGRRDSFGNRSLVVGHDQSSSRNSKLVNDFFKSPVFDFSDLSNYPMYGSTPDRDLSNSSTHSFGPDVHAEEFRTESRNSGNRYSGNRSEHLTNTEYADQTAKYYFASSNASNDASMSYSHVPSPNLTHFDGSAHVSSIPVPLSHPYSFGQPNEYAKSSNTKQ
ncbi:hypothetical protein BB560_004007 [Smittium megazygosporum]|uniref:DH domain-containing protein n=1 Tax=Smittium megazygosporum TaxID=133381 RepID=A0A2T9ZAF6_9FUNG|nr:hypothetical protein BB560_004007 [Smittium megazygosporum]